MDRQCGHQQATFWIGQWKGYGQILTASNQVVVLLSELGFDEVAWEWEPDGMKVAP